MDDPRQPVAHRLWAAWGAFFGASLLFAASCSKLRGISTSSSNEPSLRPDLYAFLPTNTQDPAPLPDSESIHPAQLHDLQALIHLWLQIPRALARPVEVLPGWVLVSRLRVPIVRAEAYIPYHRRWEAVSMRDPDLWSNGPEHTGPEDASPDHQPRT